MYDLTERHSMQTEYRKRTDHNMIDGFVVGEYDWIRFSEVVSSSEQAVTNWRAVKCW